jgi:hypothetical protein
VTERNELLADPNRYQGRIVALKAIYVKSSDVKEPLQLSPDERCWSVLLLDVKYCHALQIFTSEDPQKFKKNQLLYLIGVFLTTRLDEPEKGDTASPIVVPVFVGTLQPVADEVKPVENNNLSLMLMTVVFLTILYFLVRIYVGRKINRNPIKDLSKWTR